MCGQNIVPMLDQVVECFGKESFGLVVGINHKRSKFTGIFASEPDITGPSFPEEDVPFSQIIRIVSGKEAEEFKLAVEEGE